MTVPDGLFGPDDEGYLFGQLVHVPDTEDWQVRVAVCDEWEDVDHELKMHPDVVVQVRRRPYEEGEIIFGNDGGVYRILSVFGRYLWVLELNPDTREPVDDKPGTFAEGNFHR